MYATVGLFACNLYDMIYLQSICKSLPGQRVEYHQLCQIRERQTRLRQLED